ncbi:exopolyphosphatase [Geomonas limicola]|uniref:Exopolyphosphatase n=1 Tax=Geomonas limicola TaxID=2740186 RepID=A0A6V8N1R5_9BACT|nr:exopolyphosphatase [Geomonas limicola]GFO66436.1 exopolyphosphatase [Geomonas limicola]
MKHPVASIDLGTNTARLLIANLEPFQQILLKRTITRLGGGFTREHGLSAEAVQRSLAALAEFAGDMKRHGVERLRAVATSAVRDAANGAEFCTRVKAETGIELEVIDGHQEALFTLVGVSSILTDKARDLAVFDIGGGSTEYTLARGSSPLFSRSLPLGVVRLTEGKGDLALMQDKIVRELSRLKRDLEECHLLDDFARSALVGTAGTATSLAAIQLKMTDYDYRKVNNCVVTNAQVQEIFQRLLPLTPAQRLQVVGLEPGREDLIIAGTLVVLETMRIFGFQTLTVSDAGLLEGLLLES